MVRTSRRAVLPCVRHEPHDGSRRLKTFLEARNHCQTFVGVWAKDFTAPKPPFTGGSQWPWKAHIAGSDGPLESCPPVPSMPLAGLLWGYPYIRLAAGNRDCAVCIGFDAPAGAQDPTTLPGGDQS